MSLVTVRRNPATATDRFGPSAFARSVGKVLPMTFGGQVVVGTAVLVAVEVAADGSHALLTFDLDIPPDRPVPAFPPGSMPTLEDGTPDLSAGHAS